MDIPDTELQKVVLWKYQSRKQRITEDCNGVCIPKMMKLYLQLVHHILTQIGFQYVSSQSSVHTMLSRTDYQQLPSDLPTTRVIQRTGFVSHFSKSCYNPDFLQSSDKNSSLNEA